MTPGTIISDYEIVSHLGSGGMGVVYKARDLKLDRMVALKFLPSELSRDEAANQRFVQEAKAVTALDHPNICRVHDIRETDDGRLFIVMAFYDGQTLKSRLNDGPLDQAESLDIAHQIASGLVAAHGQGVIHRDIKPGNIIITEKGQVKILDFGLAKLTGGLDLTRTGSTLGTAHYMSPEQIRGETVDERTDLWSLGVVLYQMLTGNRPFTGEYDQAVTYAILNQPAAELPPEIPELMVDVCRRLLEKDPNDRIQGVAALMDRLGRDSAGFGVRPSRAPIRATRSWTGLAAGGKRWLTAGLAIVAVAAGGIYLGRSPDNSPSVESLVEPVPEMSDRLIAIMPFSVRGSDELAYLDESMVDLLSVGLRDAGDLQTVDPNSLFGYLREGEGAVRDPQRGLEVATRFGAGRFVLGSVTKVGPQIRINASLYDRNAQLLQLAEANTSTEEALAAMVDTLVLQLVAGQVADPIKEIVPLVAKTTHSFPALKAYLRAEYSFRQGRINEGLRGLDQAVAIDTTFALAWDRMGDWRVGPAWGRVLRHRDRLPTRERILVESQEGPHSGFDERFVATKKVVELYPRFARAWFRLADYAYHWGYQNGRFTSEAKPYLEQASQLEPNNLEMRNHLITLAYEAHDFALGDSLLEDYARSAPEDFQTRVWLLTRALRRGEESELDTLIGGHPGLPAIAAVEAMSQEDVKGGLVVAEKLTGGPLEQDRALIEGIGYTAQGRFRAANRRIEPLADEQPSSLLLRALSSLCFECPVEPAGLNDLRDAIVQWDTTEARMLEPGMHRDLYPTEYAEVKSFLLGLVSFRLDDQAALERHRHDVEQVAARKGDMSRAFGLAQLLTALSRWRRGDSDGALEAIELVRRRKPHMTAGELCPIRDRVFDRYLRAEILFAEGRWAESLPWFASLNEAGHRAVWGITYLGPSLLRRAEAYEQLGETEKAIEFYRRFIKLWESADPELQPLVARARRSLDQLILAGVREGSPG